MKRRTNRSVLAVLTMIISVIAVMGITASAVEYVEVDFVNMETSAVKLIPSDGSYFTRITVLKGGTISESDMVVPYRTDTLDKTFDGWYTASTGGEKVTTSTKFNTYTILYPRWIDKTVSSSLQVNYLKIYNSPIIDGYTVTDYDNNSKAPSDSRVTGGRDYSIYNGLNMAGTQLTGTEKLDKTKDYTVVTSVKISQGNYFAKGIVFLPNHGQLYKTQYIGTVSGRIVTSDVWFAGASKAMLYINMSASGFGEKSFTTQPVGGTVKNDTPYNAVWAVNFEPDMVHVQHYNNIKNEWVYAQLGNQNGAVVNAWNGRTERFRAAAYIGDDIIYSDEFTVTWAESIPVNSVTLKGNYSADCTKLENVSCTIDGTSASAAVEVKYIKNKTAVDALIPGSSMQVGFYVTLPDGYVWADSRTGSWNGAKPDGVVKTSTMTDSQRAFVYNVTVPNPGTAPYVFPFMDVPESQWYYEWVKGAHQMGLINGKTETTYCPNDNMTYAEAIKLAACMHQKYTTGSVTLTNGSPNWYDSYVDYCLQNGIITQKYSAVINSKIDRQSYAAIFAKALPAKALSAKNTIPDGSIPDVSKSNPNYDAIYTLYRAGIVNGSNSKGSFNPTSNIKRSEVAAILMRMMDESVRVGAPADLNN